MKFLKYFILIYLIFICGSILGQNHLSENEFSFMIGSSFPSSDFENIDLGNADTGFMLTVFHKYYLNNFGLKSGLTVQLNQFNSTLNTFYRNYEVATGLFYSFFRNPNYNPYVFLQVGGNLTEYKYRTMYIDNQIMTSEYRIKFSPSYSLGFEIVMRDFITLGLKYFSILNNIPIEKNAVEKEFRLSTIQLYFGATF